VVASICGTDYDPQGYDNQKEKLEKAGVIVMENNGMAARMAAAVINGLRGELKIELK
jgi:FdrA protein